MVLAKLLNISSTRAFLQDGQIYDVLDELVQKYQLPEDRTNEFLDLADAILDDQLPLADMPTMIAEAFAIDEEKAKQIAADVAGYRLLPLEKYLPGVEKQIVAWGGDVKAYPALRVEKERITSEKFAERIAQKANVQFSDVLIKRLAFLLEQRLAGQKTDDSLRTFFGRSLNIGGLGLSKEQNDAVMKILGEEINGVELGEVGTDKDGSKTDPPTLSPTLELRRASKTDSGHDAPSVDVQTGRPSPSLRASRPVSLAAGEKASDAAEPAPIITPPDHALEIMPTHAVAAQVPVISGEILHEQPKKQSVGKGTIDPSRTRPATKKSQDDAIAQPDIADVKLAKKLYKTHAEALQGAFAKAIDNILEKAGATLDEVQLPRAAFADIAGKTLRGIRDLYQTHDILERDYRVKGAHLPLLLEAIKAGLEMYRLAGEAVSAVDGKDEEIAERDADRIELQEAEMLDKKFAALTGSLPTDSIAPILPGAQVSGARDAHAERAAQATAATARAQEVKPAPAKVMLTKGSVPPVTEPAQQKKVADVVPGNKLMGPIEQLASMNLADFRRLSPQPEEAVRKIESLLETLEKSDYQERVRGILAWRKSPLQTVYVRMMTESLQNAVAIAEIAARLRAKGDESLGPAEVKALSGLNERLRF